MDAILELIGGEESLLPVNGYIDDNDCDDEEDDDDDDDDDRDRKSNNLTSFIKKVVKLIFD